MVQWPNLTRFLSRRFAPMQQAMSTPMRFAWLALPGWVVLKRLISTDGFGGLWLAHVIPLAYLAVLFIWTKVKERKFTSYAQKSPTLMKSWPRLANSRAMPRRANFMKVSTGKLVINGSRP